MSASGVHFQVANWFDNQAIYDWFADHLHLIPNPSMRNYVRALELQQAGINWVQHLLADVPPPTRLVAELRANPKFATEKERIQAFTERGGGSRATYFNHKKKLRHASTGEHLRVELVNSRTPAPRLKAA